MNTKSRTLQRRVFVRQRLKILDELLLKQHFPKNRHIYYHSTYHPIAQQIISEARSILYYSPYTIDRDVWIPIVDMYSRVKLNHK